MKKLHLFFALLSLVLAGAEKAPRRAVVSKEIEQIDDFEIVSPNNTPLMKWTSAMLQRSLEAATGRKAARASTPTRPTGNSNLLKHLIVPA